MSSVPDAPQEMTRDVRVTGCVDVPALVFGSNLTAVGVVRSLGRARIPSFSVCPAGDLLTKCRWYHPPPGPQRPYPSPGELPEFLESLPVPRAILIPCSDDWAKAISELPSSLTDRFAASISSAAIIATMTDKWQFAQMLDRVGVPHPSTNLLRSLDQMAALPEESYKSAFLKPLNSQEFSRRHGAKAFLIQGKADALAIMRTALESGFDGFPILLQEYIPGPPTNHYFVDGFVDRERRISALFARQRLRMFPPLLGNSTLMETIPLAQIKGAVDTVERMWSAVPYRGIFSAEFKYDPRDGDFKILEVNARPWWFVEFATRCGVDVCEMSCRDALGLPVQPVTEYPIGRRCVYLHNDFTAFRSDPKNGSLWSWVRSWQGADATVFAWDDPRPAAVTSFATLVRKIRQKRAK